MIWVYPEQLFLKNNKKIKSVYILYGNDQSYLLEIQLNILNKLNNHISDHVDRITIELHNSFDWNQIFKLCKTTNLFSKQKILSLIFSQDYSISNFNKNMQLLYSWIHDNLIVILIIHTSYQIIKHKNWMHYFDQVAIFVYCIVPEHTRLEQWIKKKSKSMNLNIENSACRLLCHYYEGNITLLHQTLQNLSIMYPDGYLNLKKVKHIIIDSAFFNIDHCVEAILLGNKQRAYRILKRLKFLNINFKTLLNKIQYEILIIIQIKYNMKKGKLLSLLFKEYKIYTKHHRAILSQGIQRLNSNQLNKTISLLWKLELKFHQEHYTCLSQSHFELLIDILCSNNQITAIYDI